MKRAAILLASLLLLAGCGSSTQTEAKSGPSVSPSSSSTPTETPTTEAPSPSESAEGQYSQIGQTWDAGTYNVRVLQVREKAPSAAPADSGRWDAALARLCNVSGDALMPAWNTWELFDKQSGEYPAATSTYNGMLKPEYPFFGDQALPAGRCVQGWIYFDVSTDTKAIGAAYVSEDGTAHLWVKPGLLPG